MVHLFDNMDPESIAIAVITFILTAGSCVVLSRRHLLPFGLYAWRTPELSEHCGSKGGCRLLLGRAMLHGLMPALSMGATISMAAHTIVQEGPTSILSPSFWTAVLAQVLYCGVAAHADDPSSTLLDIMAMATHVLNQVFLSLPGAFSDYPTQCYRVMLQLIGALLLFEVKSTLRVSLAAYIGPASSLLIYGQQKEPLFQTLFADALLALGLVMMLHMVHLLIERLLSKLDKVAEHIEAYHNMLSAFTCCDMMISRDSRICSPNWRCRHYLAEKLDETAGLLNLEELSIFDILHESEERNFRSFLNTMERQQKHGSNLSRTASKISLLLCDSQPAEIYCCCVNKNPKGQEEPYWLISISELAQKDTFLDNPTREGDVGSEAGSVLDWSDSRGHGLVEMSLPEVDSIGFTLDMYSEELTMLAVKLNFNVAHLLRGNSPRVPSMRKWLAGQTRFEDFHEWLVDQVQAELSKCPTYTYPHHFEIQTPGRDGGMLKASAVALTHMHDTEKTGSEEGTTGDTSTNDADGFDCFLVHVECKNIVQRSAVKSADPLMATGKAHSDGKGALRAPLHSL